MHDTQHKPRLYRPQQHAQDVVAHQQMYSSPQPTVNQQYRVEHVVYAHQQQRESNYISSSSNQ